MRDRDRERETDRQTDRDTQRETETDIQSQTETETEKQRERDRETERQRQRETDREGGRRGRTVRSSAVQQLNFQRRLKRVNRPACTTAGSLKGQGQKLGMAPTLDYSRPNCIPQSSPPSSPLLVLVGLFWACACDFCVQVGKR